MKYLITGGSGQLGHDLYKLLDDGKNEILAPTSEMLNLLDPVSIYNVVSSFKPNVIIHAAAYTAVDKAEANLKEMKTCYNVNYLGTKRLVDAARRVNAKIIYISTDYVFDGNKEDVYKTSDKPNPINWYGKTKLKGEESVLNYDKGMVVRTQWVFGINGNNFVKTMLKLSLTKDEISVVSDQIGAPTYTRDLAKRLILLSELETNGIYHASNVGDMSWYEFAKMIFDIAKIPIVVNPIKTYEYKTIAPRPLNTTLDKIDFYSLVGMMPYSVDATERYIDELKSDSEMNLILKEVNKKWKK